MPHRTLSAPTEHGVSIPVIDITHPAFTVTATEAELAAMADQFVQESIRTQEVSAHVRGALERSRLGRGVLASAGSYLSGLSTYLLKLGPDNLSEDADPIDRRLAASFPALCARIRLQDTARLLADGLLGPLQRSPERPLRFVNIGGGAAADSFNALILLRSEHPALLTSRVITIDVFDVDEEGPAFGARALDALLAAEGPLAGLDIGFSHLAYDWARAGELEDVLTRDCAGNEITAVSSEGGLFEYGTDDEIVANLEAADLCTVYDAITAGSVTRPCRAVDLLRIAGDHTIRPRAVDAFVDLVARAGWRVERVVERPLANNVMMVKAR